MKDKKKLTTASGKPYFENEDSMTVGARGPILLQDYHLHEKLAHFNRERIPERVVHAKGTGGHLERLKLQMTSQNTQKPNCLVK